MSLVDLNKLRLVLLPGSYPETKYVNLYQTVYQCWRSVWDETYKELGVQTKLHSDEFTRQTQLVCVFYGTECVGMMFMHWADFGVADYRNDSYFKIWTDEDIKKLTQYGPQVIVLSNMTVNPLWRQSHCPVSMKELVGYLCNRLFKESQAQAMATCTRRQKGIHHLSYRFGAVPIREDIAYFNEQVRVDMVATYKNVSIEGQNAQVVELGRKLWQEKTLVAREILSIPLENEKNDYKKAA